MVAQFFYALDRATLYYYYDAAGSKLRKKVNDYSQGGTVVKDYLYINGFVYMNDTLQYVHQEEGRIRWTQKRNNTNGTIYYAFEYDYYLRDHLNNVRAVITEGKDTATYAATMESADSVVVQKLFSNVYDPVRTVSAKPAAFDGNSGNVNVSKLTGNPPSGGQGGRIGPSLVLKVMAGDKVQINTFAYYNGATQTPVSDNTLLTDLLSTLVSGVTAQSSGKIGSGNSTALSNAVSPNVLSFLNNRTYSSSLPKAYLNWVLLDNQFKYVASNSSAMQVQPGSSKQPLVAPLQTMAKNGYLYVYVSNQSPQDVYFDDLIVTHTTGPLVQEQSYYPFGLQMAGISDKAMLKLDSKNKFNGGVELEEDYGVNLYSTFYREYDPQIGRFGGVDVLSERTNSLSTYHFSNNNPISFNDPSGALFNHTDPFGRTIYSVEERFNNFEMTLISEGRGGGGGGGDYSAFWNNLWNSAPEGQNTTYTSNSFLLGNDPKHPYGYTSENNLGAYNTNTYHGDIYDDAEMDETFFLTSFKGLALHDPSSVGQPGALESAIPFWGSGRAAVDDFQNGHWGWGLFHTAMAVSDIFLVKSAVTGIGKLAGAGIAKLAAGEGTNVVYHGIDAAGAVKYIGITGRYPAIRFAEHKLAVGTGKELLDYEVIDGATSLSRIDARIWEQGLINDYGLDNLLNIRNSIAPQYWTQYGIMH